ncbi:MAG: hypothetical protein WCK63_12825 [Betaproteobacteria bacterium]
MSKMKEGVVWLPVDAPAPKPINIDSPALDVMTDLRKVVAATVSSKESIPTATKVMIARRVRLLLVANSSGVVEGLISARDAMGEKPVNLLRDRRGARFEDLIVSDLMVPRQEIDVLDIDTVLHANVGSIIETLKQSGRQHALVIETDPTLGGQFVRGIFSATQIARQLGVPIPIEEVAQTFAEIATVLVR